MDAVRSHCRYRHILVFCVVLAAFAIVVLGYVCSGRACAAWTPHYSVGHPRYGDRGAADDMGGPLSFLSHPLSARLSFDDVVREPDFRFDIEGSDVIVFLHVQKTGGTAFGRHLVRDLDLERPCACRRGKKKCRCSRPHSEDRLWLFSRYSTGWKCGLHADWTELTNCVDSAMDETERASSKRRYFYITLMREPVSRFLSEYRHVQRGATWKTARHLCGGRTPTPEELPPCFEGRDWSDVTLDQFIGCESNLAFNRQTRMLADLTLVGCYNRSAMPRRQRDLMMLASAKQNLRRMAFFGLCEFQRLSQSLFENTFHLKFLRPFEQANETRSSAILDKIGEGDLRRIRDLNRLDLALYEFAKALLMDRHRRLGHNIRTLDANESAFDAMFDAMD